MIRSIFATKNEFLQMLFTLINFETLKLLNTGALTTVVLKLREKCSKF